MWGKGGTQDVILVPADKRKSFLEADQLEHIRIHGSDGQTWQRPETSERDLLLSFIAKDLTENSESRFWNPHVGIRIGYDEVGVYFHQDHLKRYFGIMRETASIFLKQDVPEAVPKFGLGSRKMCSNERMLGNLMIGLEKISDTARDNVLRAAFRGVDKNNNGTLDKQEMVALIRRVMPTMSGKQVVDLMEAADSSGDGLVDYQEFVVWLRKYAPKDVHQRLADELETEYDCVRAIFRIWDKNGDGLITKRELDIVLKKTCSDMTENEVKIMCMHMDKNKDGKIDYDEFVEFLFGGGIR